MPATALTCIKNAPVSREGSRQDEADRPEDRRIANIHQAAFTPFVYPDGVALGDSVLQLDDSQHAWAPASTSTACPPA